MILADTNRDERRVNFQNALTSFEASVIVELPVGIHTTSLTRAIDSDIIGAN